MITVDLDALGKSADPQVVALVNIARAAIGWRDSSEDSGGEWIYELEHALAMAGL